MVGNNPKSPAGGSVDAAAWMQMALLAGAVVVLGLLSRNLPAWQAVAVLAPGAVAVTAVVQLRFGRQARSAARQRRREWELTQILAEEREQFKRLFDGVDDIIYVADPDSYKLLFVNEYFRRVLDENALGGLCYKVLQDRDAPCPFCTNDKIFGDYLGRSYVWEFQNEVTKRWYRCSDKAIIWSDGRLVRFELASDITDERAQDQNRIQLEKLGAIGQLTAGVAHELNNPLMGVINAIQYCAEEMPDGHRCREVLDNAEHYTRRCIEIVGDLLAFSRSGAAEPSFYDADPAALVERVVRLLRYRLDKEQIRLGITANAVEPVRMQAARIEQVLMNLVTNAMDAVAELGDRRIDIELRETEDALMIEVADNGAGIPDSLQGRIFDPFFTTKAVGKGTGLGLSTSWSIVADHGGNLSVDSAPGQGTRMRVRLPRTAASAPVAMLVGGAAGAGRHKGA